MQQLGDTSHGMQSAWIGPTGETLDSSIILLEATLQGGKSGLIQAALAKVHLQQDTVYVMKA